MRRQVETSVIMQIERNVIKQSIFQDVKYLTPYLEEVIRERQEKEVWDKK